MSSWEMRFEPRPEGWDKRTILRAWERVYYIDQQSEYLK